MSLKQKHRKILVGCFAISLFFHAMGVIFLQRYSLWFAAPRKEGGESINWLSLVDKKERDQILKTAFEPILSEKEKSEVFHKPHQEIVPSFDFRSPVHLSDPPSFSNFILNPFAFSAHELLAFKPVIPIFSIPSEPINLLDHLPKDLIVPLPSKQQRSFLPLPTKSDITLSATPPKLEQEVPATPMPYSEPLDLSLTEELQVGKAPAMISFPDLPKLPTLEELETSSYSDSFDAELVFVPREEGGHIFALTLIPRPDLQLPKIRQHFTFLIDRSNSIQQGRLAATKTAIHKALGELYPEDTFNIIAFDSKIEKMAPNFLPCIGKSFVIAEEFLQKIQLGSFFASSDLSKLLFLTVPESVQDDELYTAILLTDGESLAKKTVQRSILHDWTQYNRGKVALYALGMNGDSHLATLDAIAAFNKGKLFNAPTNRGLKRKLLKILKTIQTPIAKNLSCKAISRSPHAKIQLFPKPSQMSHLYLDQPYVILGETDTLDDFIFFLQGRLKDRWLNIKKPISFLTAKKGNKSLKGEWVLQHVYNLYERYFLEDNPKLIAEAQTLLAPFDHPAALQ